MIVDSQTLLKDEVRTLEQGMDSGRAPILLKPEKAAYIVNGTVRGGYLHNRPAFVKVNLTNGSPPGLAALTNNLFQGAEIYDVDDGVEYIMVMAGGRLLRIDLVGRDVTDITPDAGLSATAKMAWMAQADVYFCVQDGIHTPYIYQYGSAVRRAQATELPVGQAMAYGQGRLWLSQGREFIAGDIYGGPTSVISFTENQYIAEATNFGLPLQSGKIVGMTFIEVGDTTSGQGELMVVARNAIWTVHTTLTPRSQWQQTPNLITVGLSKVGGVGHRCLTNINSDMFFRSRDGWRSYRMARNVQMYSQYGWGAGQGGFWGYTPISREMNRIIKYESLHLLDFASSCLFKNRLLATAMPVQQANPALPPYYTNLLALDFEVVSGMSDKLPPAWDGAWTGQNIYQVLAGTFAGVERCFAFCASSSTGKTEMWEILDDGDASATFFDQDQQSIQTVIETRALDCQKPRNLKEIRHGELYFSNVQAATNVTVNYKSDGYSAWIPWCGPFEINGHPIPCPLPECYPLGCPVPGYWFKKRLPMPDTACDSNTNKLLRNGFYFQVQIVIDGPATLEGFVLYCNEHIEDPNGACCYG